MKAILTTACSLTKLSTPDNARYLEQVGAEHRKRFGQFFTHPAVASFMVEWVLGAGGTSLYDPAFGLGAFLAPIVSNGRVNFTASEIDPTVLRFWADATGGDISFVTNEDYMLSWGRQHENIVCNPPYMRFQKFLNREAVFNAFSQNLKLRLLGYTNIASAFLLKSLSELDSAGRMAYIMPLEFLNTGYGKLVKAKLLEGGHLVAIINLECERDIIPDAITSVGIILYDAGKGYSTVDFHTITAIDALDNVLESAPATRIAWSDLDPNDKWLSYFTPTDYSINVSNMVTLDYYGHFSRGIATGANEFFTLRPSEVRLRGMGEAECIPCLTRSSQVRGAIFSSADYDSLVQDDAPVLLFSAAGTHSPEAEQYIQFGEAKGYHKRFITRNRRPWYKTEIRAPAPLLIGVFARGGYKIIRNHSSAVSLSCFHGFRPNLCGQQYIDHLFLYLASQPGRQIVSRSMRRYGNSLSKFEPNDINEVYAPTPGVFDEMTDKDVRDALLYVKETGHTPDYIDAFFEQLKLDT